MLEALAVAVVVGHASAGSFHAVRLCGGSIDYSMASEVIQEWADFDSEGQTFERGRMEKNVQDVGFINPAGLTEEQKDPRKGVKLKNADIQSLVRSSLQADDLLISQKDAEAALVVAGGDIKQATHKLLREARVQ